MDESPIGAHREREPRSCLYQHGRPQSKSTRGRRRELTSTSVRILRTAIGFDLDALTVGTRHLPARIGCGVTCVDIEQMNAKSN
jgi:hypothetical protein